MPPYDAALKTLVINLVRKKESPLMWTVNRNATVKHHRVKRQSSALSFSSCPIWRPHCPCASAVALARANLAKLSHTDLATINDSRLSRIPHLLGPSRATRRHIRRRGLLVEPDLDRHSLELSIVELVNSSASFFLGSILDAGIAFWFAGLIGQKVAFLDSAYFAEMFFNIAFWGLEVEARNEDAAALSADGSAAEVDGQGGGVGGIGWSCRCELSVLLGLLLGLLLLLAALQVLGSVLRLPVVEIQLSHGRDHVELSSLLSGLL